MLFQPPLTLFVQGSWGDIYCLASGEGANSCAAYHYLALTNHYLSAKRLELIATEVTVRTDPVSKPRCKRQTWWRLIKLFVGQKHVEMQIPGMQIFFSKNKFKASLQEMCMAASGGFQEEQR